MFDPKQFIINTIKSMFGNEPEFRVRQYTSGWFDKGVIGPEELEIVDSYYTKLAEEVIMTTEEPIIPDEVPPTEDILAEQMPESPAPVDPVPEGSPAEMTQEIPQSEVIEDSPAQGTTTEAPVEAKSTSTKKTKTK